MSKAEGGEKCSRSHLYCSREGIRGAEFFSEIGLILVRSLCRESIIQTIYILIGYNLLRTILSVIKRARASECVS